MLEIKASVVKATKSELVVVIHKPDEVKIPSGVSKGLAFMALSLETGTPIQEIRERHASGIEKFENCGPGKRMVTILTQEEHARRHGGFVMSNDGSGEGVFFLPPAKNSVKF